MKHFTKYFSDDQTVRLDAFITERWLDPALAGWIPLSIAWLKRNFEGGELGRPTEKARYSSKL